MKIALFAPSSTIDHEALLAIQTYFEQESIETIVPNNLAKSSIEHRDLSPHEKLQDLEQLAVVENLHFIWCVRGGFGFSGLLPLLRAAKLKIKSSPALIGFSDATLLLHWWLESKQGRAIHGPVAVFNEDILPVKNAATGLLLSFIKILGNNFSFALEPKNSLAKQSKRNIAGRLIGGNLSIVSENYSLYNFQDALLLLEDTGESWQRLERKFQTLNNHGVFSAAKACVCGSFTHQDSEQNRLIQEKLPEILAHLPCPVFSTHEIGHGDYNYPLELGVSYAIQNKQGQWGMALGK